MRTFFSQTVAASHPTTDSAWFPGLPHAVSAAATWLVFGGAACVSGLLLAALVSFVVWLPLTALALNDGRPLAANDAAPTLTAKARLVLFALWTATAWGAAALAG